MNATTSGNGGRTPPQRKNAARFNTSSAHRNSRTSYSPSLTHCVPAELTPTATPPSMPACSTPHPHGPDPVTQPRRDTLHHPLRDTQLHSQRPNHPHRGGLPLDRITTHHQPPNHQLLQQNTILIPKTKSPQETQDTSVGAYRLHSVRSPGEQSGLRPQNRADFGGIQGWRRAPTSMSMLRRTRPGSSSGAALPTEALMMSRKSVA